MLPYKRALKGSSRALRNNLTDAEQKLWRHLRRKQLCGVQFYRQKPIGGFVVDFYCAAAKLVVELDGGQHFEVEHAAKDARRDAELRNMGLRVLRFDDRQALQETSAVLSVIHDQIQSRL
ncbi:MAG TPA: endonuclease domain-containing protein [Solimonas sp.]|nr:endonuclease domain-containing protein [Solimonas sp.]